MPICGKTWRSGKDRRRGRAAAWQYFTDRYRVRRGGHCWRRHGAHLTMDDLAKRFVMPKGEAQGFGLGPTSNLFATKFNSDRDEFLARHAWLETFASKIPDPALDPKAPRYFKANLELPVVIGCGINRHGSCDSEIKRVTFGFKYDVDKKAWVEVSGYPDARTKEKEYAKW